MILRELISESANAFLAPIESDFWYEYGISQKDADTGAAALLVHLGLITQAQLDRIHSEDRNQETLERWAAREKNKARRAAMDPKMLELEDMINENMRVTSEALTNRLVEKMFRPSPFFAEVANDQG